MNKQRHESDEKFVDTNYIGEEIIEPDEKPLYNEELYDHYNEVESDDEHINDRSMDTRTASELADTSNLLGQLKMELHEEDTREEFKKKAEKVIQNEMEIKD